ncbi:Ppx/GppA family phosphatase [Pelagibius litoralis]|uniref:Ppx/GppA family phosphatase n=1 Tax=Pelagibius litoralis TaxID=374515 RepID=A0A967KDP9_9PROT|nr:Ppx/GppA phosphatase family protein [Pelagibius litoralis]NIA70335.1 Ppx/GppA family phosphatase [Pelagibius litoralis]
MAAFGNGRRRSGRARRNGGSGRPDGAARGNGVYAALDLGTNNCRLLVARPSQEGFRVVDAFSRIVRLGEGLSASGKLSDQAMARTLEALKVCAAKIRRRGVTQVRAVATEACRQADNCEAFLATVRQETGIELEIISQDEEAKLAICGCAPLIDPEVPDILLFDIGGGSTEICWLKAAETAQSGSAGSNGAQGNGTRGLIGADLSLFAWASVPIGVISLAERFGGVDLTPGDYDAMVAAMDESIADFARQHDVRAAVADSKVQMLGTSGTVTTLAGVHLDLPRYDRATVDGRYLEMETVHEICSRIAGMSYGERAGHACIGEERADLVVAGCAILTALCNLWPAERLRVADRGLREGMLYTMIQGATMPHPVGSGGGQAARAAGDT